MNQGLIVTLEAHDEVVRASHDDNVTAFVAVRHCWTRARCPAHAGVKRSGASPFGRSVTLGSGSGIGPVGETS